MIYLDNAATGGEKPAAVQSAVLASLRLCANPGRSGHDLSIAAAERVLRCRHALCELFDGYAFDRVVFTKNCTEALNLALLGTLHAGDHVVTTCLEHNSVLRPLEFLHRTRNVDYDVAPLTDGKITPQSVAALVKSNTRIVCVTSASNVTGEAPDLTGIRACLPEDVLLFVDGAQGAGHLPLRMKETGIDALALAGHKGLFAIQGAGALLFSERVEIDPVLHGGTGSESHSLAMPIFYPDRLESGTLSYPAVCSLFEGALIVRAHREEYARRLTELTKTVYDALRRLKGYRSYFQPNACGITAFSHDAFPSETLAMMLNERKIAVRGGLHCAPLAHRALGTFPDGLVRASFSPLQDERQAYALIDALEDVAATSS